MMMVMVKKMKSIGIHFINLFDIVYLAQRLGTFILVLAVAGCGGGDDSDGEVNNRNRLLVVEKESDCRQPECPIYLFSDSFQEISFAIRPKFVGFSAAQGFRFQMTFLDSSKIKNTLKYTTSLPGELVCHDSLSDVTCLWLSKVNFSNIGFKDIPVFTVLIPQNSGLNAERVTFNVVIDGGVEDSYDYVSNSYVY